MKFKLTLTLLLSVLALFKGYTQTKEETIQTINSILAKSVGGTDSLQFGVYRKLGTITRNQISVDKKGLVHHYIDVDFTNGQETKYDRQTMAGDWMPFNKPSKLDGSLNYFYQIYPKRKGEKFDDAKLGDRFHYIDGDGEKLFVALNHLKNLYSKSK